MICSAVREKVDTLITRNPEHFWVSAIPARSPDEFLTVLQEQKRKSD